MKGDFSSIPGDLLRWSQVWAQQGRVQLDSDLNAGTAILDARLRAATEDLAGDLATPAATPGFELFQRGGLALKGGAYVRVPPSTNLGFMLTKPFTLEMIVSPGAGGPLWSLDPGDGSVVRCLSLAVTSQGKLTYRLVRSNGDSAGELWVLLPDPLVGFVHVAVTWDGQNAAIYVDGVGLKQGPLAPDEPPALPAPSPAEAVSSRRVRAAALAVEPSHVFPIPALLLGAGPAVGSLSTFDGTLAAVRLWGEVRTASQLEDAARRWLVTPDDGKMVAYWPLLEGSGAKAKATVGDLDGDVVVGTGTATWEPWALCLSAGNALVRGRLVHNPRAVDLAHQPYWRETFTPTAPTRVVATLEVRPRMLNWLEEPSIRDPALGSGDTTTRVVEQWQVRLAPFDGTLVDWGQRVTAVVPARLSVTRSPNEELLSNRLYRVEVACGGAFWRPNDDPGSDPPCQCTNEGGLTTTIQLDAGQLVAMTWKEQGSTTVSSHLAVVVGAPSDIVGGTMAYELDPPLPSDQRDTTKNFTVRPLAAIRWSRDNGSGVFGLSRLEDLETNTLELDPSAERSGDELASGDWVEIVEEERVRRELPSPLYQVDAVTGSTVTLTSSVASLGSVTQPYLRRWSVGQAAIRGIVPVTPDAAIALEHGITLKFEPPPSGTPGAPGAAPVAVQCPLRVGDYWSFAARYLTGQVIWPTVQGWPRYLPPAGPQRAVVPLARLQLAPNAAPSFDEDGRKAISVIAVDAPPRIVVRPEGGGAVIPSDGDPSHGGHDAGHWTQINVDGLPSGPAVAFAPTGSRIVVFFESGEVGEFTKGIVTTWQWEQRALLDGLKGAGLLFLEPSTVLITGGLDAGGRAVATVRRFDLDKYALVEAEQPPLPEPRADHALTIWRNNVLVIGGRTAGETNDIPTKSVLSAPFGRSDLEWAEFKKPLGTARYGHGAGVSKDRVLVFGGRGTDDAPMARTELYLAEGLAHDEDGQWEDGPPLEVARAGMGVTTADGSVWVLGGQAPGGVTDAMARFGPDGSWEELEPMPMPRVGAGVAAARQYLFVFGGEVGDDKAPVLRFRRSSVRDEDDADG